MSSSGFPCRPDSFGAAVRHTHTQPEPGTAGRGSRPDLARSPLMAIEKQTKKQPTTSLFLFLFFSIVSTGPAEAAGGAVRLGGVARRAPAGAAVRPAGAALRRRPLRDARPGPRPVPRRRRRRRRRRPAAPARRRPLRRLALATGSCSVIDDVRLMTQHG